ncbi:MAG: TolC family protein [Vicinamibacterales bacterium]|nr:TolC family protein [Vicinamibacterales bacterium]
MAALFCAVALRSAAGQTRAATDARADTVDLALLKAIERAGSLSQEVRLARSQVDLAAAQVRAAGASALPQIDGNVAYVRTFESPFSTGGAQLPDSLRFEPDTLATLEERVRYLERRAPTAGLGSLGQLFGDLPFGRENAYNFSLTGSQTLYSGGRLGAAQRIAREFLDVARLGLREQLAEIELQVRSAYVRARLAQEFETIAQAAVAQAVEFFAQEQLRLTAGLASELEVLRADVTLANLRPQLVQARNSAELAELDLKRLIDLPLTQAVRLVTPLAVTAEQLDTTTVDVQLLVAQRAAIRAAERQVAIREQQVRIARAAYLPSAGLRVNYGRQIFPNGAFDFRGQDWRTDFSATVALQIPIFSGFRRQAEVAQAQVQLEQERLRLLQLRESVQLQYQQALGERQRAAASISARRRTVDQAQRVHNLTVLRYDRGLATQLDVSDARLALLQARTNLAQAMADYLIAQAEVARALGTTTPAGALSSPPLLPQGN